MSRVRRTPAFRHESESPIAEPATSTHRRTRRRFRAAASELATLATRAYNFLYVPKEAFPCEP